MYVYVCMNETNRRGGTANVLAGGRGGGTLTMLVEMKDEEKTTN